jgi:hypothetical protein
LIGLVTSCLPSNELASVVFYWVLDKTSQWPNQAWYCLQCLQRTMGRTFPRRAGPSLLEIAAFKVGSHRSMVEWMIE